MNQNAASLLDSAKGVAESVENWADLSNFLFNPADGLITKAYPNTDDRKAFMKTTEYQAIRKLLLTSMKESGLVAGSVPKKSGRFVVRLPQSLHLALEREASDEGVSLNQLVVTKLAVQLAGIESGPNAEIAGIAQAYLETRDGYSIDRVIADPEMDRTFLHRCRELGVSGTDYDLNWKLMNARKRKYLSNIPKTRKYTLGRIDDFEFSSEIALVHVRNEVDRREHRVVTLDTILCDPELAQLFDASAKKLAPGFTSLEYRFAALNVRKAAGRHWQEAIKKARPEFDVFGSTKSICSSKIPTEQGIYLFRCEDQAIFVSHTDNLRTRVERHFDSSDSKGVPDWLYDSGRKTIELGILPLPSVKLKDRKLVELKAVDSYTPLLNYIGRKQKKAP